MDVQSRKLKLIEYILQLKDLQLLERIEEISKTSSDWWDQLADDEKAAIERGLAQANRGELKSHEDVMGKYQQWL